MMLKRLLFPGIKLPWRRSQQIIKKNLRIFIQKQNRNRRDFFSINMWTGLTIKNNPTQEELYSNTKKIFDERLKPFYDSYKKPIVLQQVAYPSIDGGLKSEVGVDDPAIALWEPYSDKYTLDLEEQAMGFEAILKNAAETNYITGVYPFTYWPDDFPMTKEYNIRGKQ